MTLKFSKIFGFITLAIHAGIQLWINALAKPEKGSKSANPSRVNSKFLKPLKLIGPCRPPAEKYHAWLEAQISRSSGASRPPEGRLAIVTKRGAGCDERGGVT